jgi:tetratricopeptide (TPR) repeat protein
MSEIVPTVFLSSTAKDLTEFRDAIHAALIKAGRFKCVRQEDFGGEHAETVVRCTQAAASADIFVGLIGMRRGWEPNGAADLRSITEMEYDSAKPDGRFIYITPDNFPVPGNLRESDEEHQRQLTFRKRAKERVVSLHDFKSAERLANDIVQELLAKQATPAATPPALVDALVAALEQSGFVRKADAEGLERQTIIKLARRLRPSDTLDFDQAVAALENAVFIALEAVARGERVSNEEQFVQDVLRRVAEETKAGRFDGAAKEVDDALAELDTREADQRESLQRNRLTLLESGIEQDLLRRDPVAVAGRVTRLIEVAHPDNISRQFTALRERQEVFYVEGADQAINLSLEVSIEIAKTSINFARSTEQRAVALNDLGSALTTLGERETDTDRLEQAIEAYTAALSERTREQAPLEWATTQNNLGITLKILGKRQIGAEHTERAIKAHRSALTEFTREKTPLKWAATQNNLGNALSDFGEREKSQEHLEWAVEAYRNALLECTRDHAPLEWALIQNNIGTVLAILGTLGSSANHLNEAITASHAALAERTRERTPFQWAQTQENLGLIYHILAIGNPSVSTLELSVEAYKGALEVYEGGQAIYYVEKCRRNLKSAEELLAEQRKNR